MAGFDAIKHLVLCQVEKRLPLSKTGAELLFELISRGATLITSNLPFSTNGSRSSAPSA